MLSVVVPCFNEEKLIEKSILEILKSIKNSKIIKYEIIIINDDSKDKSQIIINKLRYKYNNIRIVKNKKNFGIGYNFYKGISLSKEKYLILIPADNSHPAKEISKILKFINKNYDLITTYYSNNNKRSLFRNIFTLTYTPFLNFIYGTNFPYFNGLTLYKTNDLKKLKFKNFSFSYQIEIFVYLFHKYKLKIKIIPTILKDRKKGSKAFKLKNSILVIIHIIKIFFKSLYYRFLNIFNE
jgi:glycosyltransferase involved in cell wall biosynthesis